MNIEASDKRVCDLGHAFYQELKDIHGHNRAQSSRLLKQVSRRHVTGHQNRLESVFEDFGIQAPIPVSYVQVEGLRYKHPVLRPKDLLETMAKFGKLSTCFLHGHTGDDYLDFWNRFRQFEPNNLTFKQHGSHLSQVVPYFIHLDEGTGQKKKALLICQMHPALGLGSRRGDDLNFSGSTFKTRLLYSTLPAKSYGANKMKQRILMSLFENWANDLMALFTHGVEYTTSTGKVTKLYASCIGCKGDWPALKLAGSLTRHFGRAEKTSSGQQNGICHLCKAGMPGFGWHEYGPKASWNIDRAAVPLPWKPTQTSPLVRLAMDPTRPEQFLKIDSFHTLHKGCFADLASSAIVSFSKMVYLFAYSIRPI